MSVKLNKEGRQFLVARASDKLSNEDYEHFVPEVERRIKEEGKLRLLFEMHDFHGWQAGGRIVGRYQIRS